jgi:hypothetical protein
MSISGIHVTFDLASVRRSIAALGEAATGENMELALIAGALIPMNAAKIKAHVITGTLRRSIHIGGHTDLAPDFEFIGPLKSQYSDIGKNVHDSSGATVFVGTNLVYARREEYGFHGRDSLGRLYNQAAHPYLRPAFDDNEDAMTREVEEAWREILEHALGEPISG